MTIEEQIGRRAGWVDFLSIAVVSLLIWDGLLAFTFNSLTFTSDIWLVLQLLMPFIGLLLIARYFVWRKRGNAKTVMLSILASFFLVVGIGRLVWTVHAMIYPVHFYGIP